MAKKEWQGKCPVCGKVHHLTLASIFLARRQAIESGDVIPTRIDFWLSKHKFGGEICSGSLSARPLTFFEMIRGIVGVCRNCQSTQSVRENDLVRKTDFSEAPYTANRWIVVPHNSPETEVSCEGGGNDSSKSLCSVGLP